MWQYISLCVLTDLLSSTSAQLHVGSSGWALRFDGTDDHVLLDGALLPRVDKTIEMWIKPMEHIDGNGRRVVKWNSLARLTPPLLCESINKMNY